MSKADERCGYVTGFDGLMDCQSLIFNVLPGGWWSLVERLVSFCLKTKWMPTMQQMTSKYVPFLSTVVSEMSSFYVPQWDWNRICWTVCCMSLLFNTLYSYNRSADGSFLDVLAFHLLAGPDVCVHWINVLFLSPWCSSWSCSLRSHQPLLPECDLIHLIWPQLTSCPLMKPLLGWWCIVCQVYLDYFPS